MMPLWLYLDFPSLQLDTLYQEQASHPVIILNKEHNQVIQLNALAYHHGIRVGMGLGSAAALHKDLQVIEYRQELEAAKLAEIAQWLYFVTSDIAFWSPNGLLLRIQHMLSMYGGLPSYWQALKDRLSPLKLSIGYACGTSPLGARLLARSGHNLISQDPELLREKVSLCALEQTDLPQSMCQKLARVGIRRLKELINVPPGELAKRFDSQLVTYIGKLQGTFHHPVDFYHPPATFNQYLELMYEIDSSPILLHPIKRLLSDLERFLRLRDKLATVLEFRFSQRDSDALSLTVSSAQGEYQAQQWQALVGLKLENLVLEQPVYGIQLAVTHMQAKEAQANDLFAGKQGQMNHRQLLSLLQARLGTNAVSGLQLRDDFRPEYSSSYCRPFERLEKQNWPVPTLRPSLLLTPHRPLNEKVSLLQGPERIQTGWWDHQAIDRDYFIARNIQGQWLWVYRTRDNQWYVQGLFS